MEEQDQAAVPPSDPEATPKTTSPRARKAAAGKAGGGAKTEAQKTAQKQARQTARKKARAAKQDNPAPASAEVRPTAKPAQMRRRHFGVILSFLICVCIPSGASYWYLTERAADQYASTIGFSVRKEEVGSAVELLGGISEISTGSSSDTDILYEFIQSQNMVEQVDAKLDLRTIYTRAENDPIFALKADSTIEDLLRYWGRMVKISYDGGNGLIQVRAQAFDPDEAQAIARAIFEQSSLMINRLSAIAREDATGYAKEELDQAVARLKTTRQEITAFRNETQIVDPNADIQGQMGLLNTLQQQLAEALIELDLLRETTRTGDPRLEQAARKITVIENRINEERKKLGVGVGSDGEGRAYAALISEYEGLTVEREFAEQSYQVARAGFDSAVSDARRNTRYLAAHILPTRAEQSLFPRRGLILSFIAMGAFLVWALIALIGFSFLDRR